MAKLWEGRISGAKTEAIEEFNASVKFDKRLYREDIEGSIAHSAMLRKIGVLSEDEHTSIVEAMKSIKEDIERDIFVFDTSLEDIHTHIENALREKIGETAGKLHTARSRNDQVNVDVRMHMRKRINDIEDEITKTLSILIKKSEETIDMIMPGYTHLQPAQPMRMAHLFMAYFFMLERDRSRLRDCYKRLNMLTLGSGAFSGVGYQVDREMVKTLLGFDKVGENALDGVSDRDFILEFLSSVAIIFSHLSRMAEDFIIFSSNEYNFIELDDLYTTGSSIMPNKKNPDILELIRGKTGRVYGNLMSMLTVMKGLPSAYNKDLQEDKESLFDSIDTTMMSLRMFAECVDTMKFNKDVMLASCEKGYINAVEIADYLVSKKMPFRQAHNIVASVVGKLVKENRVFKDMKLEEWKTYSSLFENDIFDALDIEVSVEKKFSEGSTSKIMVEKQIEKAKSYL